MKEFFDSISSKIKSSPELRIYTLSLGFISLVYLVIFKYDGPWNWDDIAYLLAVFEKSYFPMLLGRSGYCYPFVAIWAAVRSFDFANFLFIEHLMLISNILLQALMYVFMFRLLVAVKVPAKVALVAVLLLLAELSYSVMGSRYNDTPLMQFCVVLSYYLFVVAHERRQVRYLIICGFVAGYALLTREAAAFNLFFFPVVYAWFHSRDLTFPSRKYAEAFAVMLAVAVSGPLILFFLYDASYISTVMKITPHYFADVDLLAKFDNFWKTQVNATFLLTGFCGLVVASFRMKIRWVVSFSFLCLTPVVIPFFILENLAIAEARFYFGMFLLFSLGSSFLVTGIAEKFPNRKVSGAFTALATLGLMFSATYRFWPQYQKELQISRRFQEYYLNVNPLLKQGAVMITGNESIYLIYRTIVEEKNAYIVSAGLRWPKGRLSETINRALQRGRAVLYDPQGDSHNYPDRKDDLNRMRAEFQLIEIEHGLYKVELKKD